MGVHVSGILILPAFLLVLSVVSVTLRKTSPCPAQRKKICKLFIMTLINMMTLWGEKDGHCWDCLRQVSVGGQISMRQNKLLHNVAQTLHMYMKVARLNY